MNAPSFMITTIELLRAAGFVEDGTTREESVRVPTQRAPVHGGAGGERRSFGGRVRMHRPDTTIYCTVGRKTTFLYHRRADTIEAIASLHTYEHDELTTALADLDAPTQPQGAP